MMRVFLTFLRLGLTSFGGPVAHVGYFHDTFVRRKKWLTEREYADIVALCQVLPGPSSSQIGMAIGLARAGGWGALAAWLGFTLPSAVLMTAAGLALSHVNVQTYPGVLRGFAVAALAVVAHALVAMSASLCPDRSRKLLAIVVGVAVVFLNHPLVPLGVLACGAVWGIFFAPEASAVESTTTSVSTTRVRRRWALVSLGVLFGLLCALPLVASAVPHPLIVLFDKFFRTGALVFGGGHVVLPLLVHEFVGVVNGVSQEVFMAGYGLAQAIPGPLFSFASFLGVASMNPASGASLVADGSMVAISLAAALASLVAIFLPSFLLIFGTLPFFNRWKEFHSERRALSGMNAAVVGLLLAACVMAASKGPGLEGSDYLLLVVNVLLLQVLRFPSWSVVLFSVAVCV